MSENKEPNDIIGESIEGKRDPILSNYILQNKIGSGSFGKVFKVKDKKNGKTYVAKISIQEIDEDSYDFLRNLSREISIRILIHSYE